MKFAHFLNFSAYWSDYGCARNEVLTVRSMRVDILPACFRSGAVMRSSNFIESSQCNTISNYRMHRINRIDDNYAIQFVSNVVEDTDYCV